MGTKDKTVGTILAHVYCSKRVLSCLAWLVRMVHEVGYLFALVSTRSPGDQMPRPRHRGCRVPQYRKRRAPQHRRCVMHRNIEGVMYRNVNYFMHCAIEEGVMYGNIKYPMHRAIESVIALTHGSRNRSFYQIYLYIERCRKINVSLHVRMAHGIG